LKPLHLVIAFCVFASIWSCGGSDDKQETSSAGGASGAASALLSSLAAIPDNSSTRRDVYFTNFEKLRSLANVPALKADAPGAEVARQLAQLRELGLVEGNMLSSIDGLRDPRNTPSDFEDTQKSVGFNNGAFDFELVAGIPPKVMTVVLGRFDSGRIDAAVKSDPSPWLQTMSTKQYGGTSYYSWGDEKQNLVRRSPLRPLGLGGRLWVGKERIFWSNFTDAIEEMIDSSQKKKPSLADAQDFRTVAQALDRYGAAVGIITGQPNRLAMADVRQLMEGEYGKARVDALAPNALRPFITLGIGASRDATGTYALLVYLHQDDRTAAENKGRLEALVQRGLSLHTNKPWSDVVSASEIKTEGPLLVAKLYSTNAHVGFDAYNNLDALATSQ
jgi:hypothetical protein